MPTFLDDLANYNAKASLAISNAISSGHVEKANMMSSLKTVANDTALEEDVRLKALTTLINVGNLLDAPIPPYFPLTQTYANALTYAGIHNELDGLNVGDYQHLTESEKSSLLNKASLSDITWANLQGSYTDNIPFAAILDGKQAALSGTGFVKANGLSITYDNSTFLTDVTGLMVGAAAGGELQGNYPSPTLNGLSVISKVLTGFTGTSMPITPISSADSILSAIQKLNNNIVNLSSNPSGVSTVALTNNAGAVFSTTTTPQGGPSATLNIALQTQNKNLFLASSSTTNGQVPAFRAIQVDDLPATGNPATTIGGSTTIPVISIDAKGRVTNLTSAVAATGGIVNTVNMTVPSNNPTIFTATGGGSSSTVNVGFGLSTQVKNTFFAGPATGINTTPQFRALQLSDIGFDIPYTQVGGLKDQLDAKLDKTLGASLLYMGNGSNQAAEVKVGGDLEALYTVVQGTNTASFTIANNSVSYTKFQNIPASAGNAIRPILLGRFSGGQGLMEELTLSADFTINGSGQIGLLTPNPPALNDVGDLLTSTGANILTRLSLPQPNNDGYLLMPYAAATSPACGLIWGEVLGDITYTVDDTTTPGTPFGAFSIGANKVTLSKIQTIADQRILGNISGGAAIPTELTLQQVVDALPLQDALTGTTQGVVPASNFTPALGYTKDDYFLTANNGWSLGGGGGGLPGGSPWQFQYNDNGTAFAGSANLAATNAGDVLTTSGYFGIVDDATTPTVGVYISAPNVSVAGLDWSIPATNANDIFVGEAFAQTLTNKTLGASTFIDIPGGGTDAGTLWYSKDVGGTVGVLPAAGNIGKFLRQSITGVPEWAIPTDIDGGLANQILYQVSPGDTSFIAAPTISNTFLKWTGSAFSWDFAGSGTINNANQYSVTYYSAAGSANTLSGLTPQAVNGTYFLSQAIAGGAASAPAWTGVTGSGSVVLSTSPTLSTPILGVASATSINKVAITAPATSATLTIADNKTFTVSNTLTLTGSDASSIAFGGGGTVAYIGTSNSWTAGVKQTFTPNATNAGINVGSLATDPSAPANGDLVYNSTTANLRAYINGGWVSLGGGITTPVSVANGGTGITTATAYAVICAGTTSTGAFQNVSSVGTAGHVLTSNGPGALPTWQTAVGGASSLTTLSAATATASINNANSIITWNWSINTTQNAFVLNSISLTTASLLSVTHTTSALTGNLATITSTGVTTGNLLNLGISGTTATSAKNLVITNTGTTNTSGRGIDVSISGATNSGNTFAAVLSNTKTGTTSINTAAQLTASGGTTNYAIDVTAGISRFAAGTAASPQLILTPSTAAGGTTFTGTVNGSLWYDTNSTGTANSCLTLYKDTSWTKILTLERNPDFATGSGSGIVIADVNGTLSKSADLTALGIFSVYADATSITGTAATTMIGTSLTGSTTLPANFFGLGKTIRIYASGDITSANTDDTVITFKLGATTVGTFNIDNLHSTTANDWSLEAYIICNATGASGTVRVGATFFVEGATPSGGHSWYMPITTSSTISTTSSLAIDVLNDFVQSGMTMNVKFMTCYYLN